MEAQNINKKSTPIRLDVLDANGEIIQTSEYVKDKLVLGRILSADLRVDDPRVSRIHALLELRNNKLLLTDLASSHGTYVNGEKVVEKALKWGDTIKLGQVSVRISQGSGQVSAQPAADPGRVYDDATLVDIDRSMTNKLDRRDNDRRKKDVLPEEKRLSERREGDRRVDERTGDERRHDDEVTVSGAETPKERRTDAQRRLIEEEERRVGQRRQGDRRVFDITSLERRISDRRTRKDDDDMLPQELEKAFDPPAHARELEVTAMWGDHILDVSNYYDECTLHVGEGPRNEYIIPSVGIPDEFPLVNIEQDGNASLSFTEKMTGTLRVRDKVYSLKDVASEKFVKQTGGHSVITLKQDDFAKISIGNISFFILYVAPAPRIKAPPILDKDPLLMRTYIGSFLLFALLMVGISFIEPPKPMTIEEMPERFAKIVIKKRPNIKSADGLKIPGADNKQGGSKAGEGGPAIGAEGEAGKKELPKSAEKPQTLLPRSKPDPKGNEQAAAKKPADTKPELVKRKVVDEKKAKSVGLLKAFSDKGIQGEVQNLLDAGEGKPGKGGFDDFGKAVIGFRGKGIEEVGGAGGKGLKGVGPGGGGKTIGIDGPSTKGLGRGYHGDGIGEGIDGPGRFGQKGEAAISIVSENIQVLSGLSKDLIEATVNRYRSQIRGCYDAALTRNPKVKGKVTMAFVISPQGVVKTVNVKESTVGDGGLEQCIASRIRSWQFPKPEAPVDTDVAAYPFYFNPAN